MAQSLQVLADFADQHMQGAMLLEHGQLSANSPSYITLRSSTVKHFMQTGSLAVHSRYAARLLRSADRCTCRLLLHNVPGLSPLCAWAQSALEI